jgi:hypothetical protein
MPFKELPAGEPYTYKPTTDVPRSPPKPGIERGPIRK